MDKKQLEILIEEGLSQRQIGNRLSKSQGSVKHWLNKFGLKTKTKEVAVQICQGCGIEIFDNRHERKFCSNSCQRNQEWELRKNRITKKGKENSPVCAKRYLKETRGVKCEMCDITEWCGQTVPLVLDHVDGNSEDNRLDNLRLVCGNCDMQLPTYKSKNRGNGRHSRRKRYAEGKSY
jgi:hypothetical protein